MLPHHNITGGMKCLVEHVRLLRAKGHYTIAVHRSDTTRRAMPPWTSVEAGGTTLLLTVEAHLVNTARCLFQATVMTMQCQANAR